MCVQLLHTAEASRPLVVLLDHSGQLLERHHGAPPPLSAALDAAAQDVLTASALQHLEELQHLLAVVLGAALHCRPPSRTPPPPA